MLDPVLSAAAPRRTHLIQTNPNLKAFKGVVSMNSNMLVLLKMHKRNTFIKSSLHFLYSMFLPAQFLRPISKLLLKGGCLDLKPPVLGGVSHDWISSKY